MPDNFPKRGEVWLVSFAGSIGGEIQKTRPAIIISNDAANSIINRVQAVPISSQTEKLYPAETVNSVNGERRKAMADRITTISKQRLLRCLGEISTEDLNSIVRVICLQLGI